MLTIPQSAILLGISESAVKKRIANNQLVVETTKNKNNRPLYLIPLSSLPDECQVKWYKQQLPTAKTTIEVKSKGKKLDQFSALEREEIAFWFRTIDKWQEYRRQTYENKTAIDEQFVASVKLENPEMQMSVKTLYRHYKAVKEADLEGLVDSRGKTSKGTSTVTEEMWGVFQFYYLDEAQHRIK